MYIRITVEVKKISCNFKLQLEFQAWYIRSYHLSVCILLWYCLKCIDNISLISEIVHNFIPLKYGSY